MTESVSDLVLGISILVFSLTAAYGTVWVDCWLDRRSEDRRRDTDG